MKNKLSAVIITKNEEANIGRCIESILPVADEIVVVDSYSTDDTKGICVRFGVRFFQHEWQGYARTKNHANRLAAHDWVLSIDADEVLTPELQQSILELKQKDHNWFYSFKRLNNYCGKWIKNSGWYPDVKFRLFDRRKAQWEGEFVHERLVAQGVEPELLPGDCLHYTYSTVIEHAERTAKYARLAAEEHYERGKPFSVFKLLFSPWFSFIKVYFLQGGIMDGTAGFIISCMYSYARFLRYAELWRLHRGKSR